jgi:hypothetical protein
MSNALTRAVTRWRPMPHPNHAPARYLFADISSNNGHFVTGKTTGVTEAQHFWENVKASFNPRVDRLAIDFEGPAFTALGSRSGGYLAAFDGELHRLSGEWAVGYTFRSAISAGLHVRSEKWWVASFGGSWPAGPFRRLANGTMWAYQFTDGKIGAPGPRGLTGVAGTCDVSVLSPPIVALLQKALRR